MGVESSVEGQPAGDACRVDLDLLGLALRVDLAGVHPQMARRFRDSWDWCVSSGAGSGIAAVVRPALVPPLPRMKSSESISEAAWREEAETKALMQLTQDITRAGIRARAGSALMLHAGALSNPETGASIVYVAPGGTGKTTLTRVLGPGRAYITDETVAVVGQGVILPYLKPLSVRRIGQPGLKDEVSPKNLGLVRPPRDPWVAGLVVLRRDPAMGDTVELRDLKLLDAVARLVPETSSLGRLDRPLRQIAELIERAGGVREVRYAEARSLAATVDEVLGRHR